MIASYNRYPDEKGTESSTVSLSTCSLIGVTTVTPMKRGLKDPTERQGEPILMSYNRYPDEKGTES